jgi:catalase-peroxidase
MSPEALLVERAFMPNLTAPEMTVLVGGMRALNATPGSPNTASSPNSLER